MYLTCERDPNPKCNQLHLYLDSSIFYYTNPSHLFVFERRVTKLSRRISRKFRNPFAIYRNPSQCVERQVSSSVRPCVYQPHCHGCRWPCRNTEQPSPLPLLYLYSEDLFRQFSVPNSYVMYTADGMVLLHICVTAWKCGGDALFGIVWASGDATCSSQAATYSHACSWHPAQKWAHVFVISINSITYKPSSIKN